MKQADRKKLLWAIVFSLLCPAIIMAAYYAGALERFEWMAYDTLVRLLRSDRGAHEDVAVVLIDEASLRAMNPVVGRWPWPRSVYADLLEFLYMGGPDAVVFDILFTENEGVGAGDLSQNDLRLVESTEAGGIVCHAQQILEDVEDEYNSGLLGRDLPPGFAERFAVGASGGEWRSGENNYYIPFKELCAASGGVGVVEFEPDPDGVFRRTRPLRPYKGHLYPVLGLSPLVQVLGMDVVAEDGGLMVGGTRLPLSPDGQYLINMYGSYETYSMSGMLNSIQKIKTGEVSDLMAYPEEFEGKIVFVGASAAGVEDLKPTAMSSKTPGVFLHAAIASNVLMGDFLRPPTTWVTASVVFLASAAIVYAVLFLSRLGYRIAVPLVLLFVYVVLVALEFRGNVLLDVVPAVAAVLLSVMLSFTYLSFTEGREKRKVRKMLGQYVSPQVLDVVVDRHEDFLKAEVGSREHITLLFSDIRGFTTISENLPPEKTVAMLNHYFTVWSDVIFKYGGTIDKFVGDAVMALWGAPLRTEDHAEKAVRAAIEMVGRLRDVNEELTRMGIGPIRIGIGINTGYAILGNIGSERKLDYTVIGDTVNLASRLEGLTKEFSCDILISEFTHELVNRLFDCAYVDKVKVKGKEKPVDVYRVNTSGGNG